MLDEDQSWELLAAQELGRLAYRVGSEQHLTPINYAVDVNEHGRRSLLFRTARTTKLLAAELGDEVAFEIDDVEGSTAVKAGLLFGGVSRRSFDNFAEFEALYGDVPEMEELDYPRAMSARQVPPRIRVRLTRPRVA